MGVFDRFRRVFKAKANDLLDRAEQGDPEQMLDQLLRDMTTEQAATRELVTKAMAEETRLLELGQATEREVIAWGQRAQVAVNQGNDDLARRALAVQQEKQELVQTLHGQYTAAVTSVQQLRETLRDLVERSADARNKRGVLLARHRTNQIQASVQGVGSGKESAFAKFSQMEEQIGATERQLRAGAQLDAEEGRSSTSTKALEREFARLGSGGSGAGVVEERLALLKAQAGRGDGRLIGAGPEVQGTPTPTTGQRRLRS